jgi:hypothetical protein
MNHNIKYQFSTIIIVILLALLSSCGLQRTLTPNLSKNVTFPTATLALPEPQPSQTAAIFQDKVVITTPVFLTTSSATSTFVNYSTPFSWSEEATYEPITRSNRYNYEPNPNIINSITLTPSPPEQCPQEDQSLILNIKDLEESPPLADYEATILDFLNASGSPKAVLNTFFPNTLDLHLQNYSYQDLTGDGVPEFAITYDGNLYIFACRLGKYKTTLKISNIVGLGLYDIFIDTIRDLNLDGIPEIILSTTTCNGPCVEVRIYEWDGNQYNSLIRIKDHEDGVDYARILNGSISIKDQDGNKFPELILDGGIPTQLAELVNGFPFRKETQVLSWNGKFFVETSREYSPPQYRFQAVQDGDRASLSGDYDKAADYYQQAIFSDKLDWWSADLKEFIIETEYLFSPEENPTPIPPSSDPNEYYNLAAYSRYCLMLLHILRGWLPEAQVVYNTLQEKFPDGQAGHFFAELATAFWDNYQLSNNIGESCGKAIEFASSNLDILVYLGSYDHGWQSLIYEPEDICPFK